MSESSNEPNNHLHVDYLVGGFRISVEDDSNTPGPRTHILNFVEALRTKGYKTDLTVVSKMPFMSRFARIRQSDYSNASSAKIWVADLVRIFAAVWSGANVFAKTALKPAPSIIYERVAVLQSLTSFHAKKGKAVRIVEVNGILSRETTHDRKALKAERLASLIERRVIRKADVVVAVSQNLMDEVVTFAGIPKGRVLVVPNGVSSAICRTRRNSDPTTITLGFVGSIVKWQRLERIISVLSRFEGPSDDIQLKLELVGDGPEVERLKSLVASLGIKDRVTFFGRMSHDSALDQMTTWDIGFAGHEKSSSSTMYHSPLKLYEYAALGLSIVCTNSSDAETIRKAGVPVYYFADEADLSRAVEQAIKAREEMSESTINQIRQNMLSAHTWEQRVDQVIDFALNP